MDFGFTGTPLVWLCLADRPCLVISRLFRHHKRAHSSAFSRTVEICLPSSGFQRRLPTSKLSVIIRSITSQIFRAARVVGCQSTARRCLKLAPSLLFENRLAAFQCRKLSPCTLNILKLASKTVANWSIRSKLRGSLNYWLVVWNIFYFPIYWE